MATISQKKLLEIVYRASQCFIPTEELTREQVDRLFEKRRIADYYMDKPLSKGEGDFCTGISERIIYKADGLRPPKK